MFQLSHNENALRQHSGHGVIMLACLLSALLQLHLFLVLWVSGVVSQLSQQSWLYSSLCYLVRTKSLRPDWDLDWTWRHSNPCCSFQQLLFPPHPRQVGRGGGTGLHVSKSWNYLPCSYNINNAFFISSHYCHTPSKNPHYSYLLPSGSAGQLSRRTGHAAVLIPWGWQPAGTSW